MPQVNLFGLDLGASCLKQLIVLIALRNKYFRASSKKTTDKAARARHSR
jgi:hypothetical protein